MTIDEKYMFRALELARFGGGHVSPNPMVGAVIVRDGVILGEGWHRRYGEAHAEVNAVRDAERNAAGDAMNNAAGNGSLRGSTIYVTLEPCSHYGKTPPCAKLLVEKGFRRVVVGVLDPFEKVRGRGVQMLREAGIEVVTGVLEQECRALNERFFTAHTTGMPWVMLKWAESADGFIASETGAVALSTPLTLRLMHCERSRCDAILVGAGTVRVDNPSLTTRHWCGRSPLRVVLDGACRQPDDNRVLTDGAPTLVYNRLRECKLGGAEWVRLDTYDLRNVLRDLYSRGVTSVMVEGGADVLGQFIDGGFWNEARVETAPCRIGKGVRAPKLNLEPIKIEKFGKNTVRFFRPHVKKV